MIQLFSCLDLLMMNPLSANTGSAKFPKMKNYIFWVLDPTVNGLCMSCVQPQEAVHLAHKMQDTFDLSDLVKSLSPPHDYYEHVLQVHEHSGYGSVGYHALWSDAKSHKLLLHMHMTTSSAHMLYKLTAWCCSETLKDSEEYDLGATSGHEECKASLRDNGFYPAKLFSIDHIFHNKTMDATHLAEFHQVEGVIADQGLTLADLIGLSVCLPYFLWVYLMLTIWHTGFMHVFFKKMGIENLCFKPAYNPYTKVCRSCSVIQSTTN